MKLIIVWYGYIKATQENTLVLLQKQVAGNLSKKYLYVQIKLLYF
jgi:hypothetical protein